MYIIRINEGTAKTFGLKRKSLTMTICDNKFHYFVYIYVLYTLQWYSIIMKIM